MPAITIQQAYAIALGAYINLSNQSENGRINCSTGLALLTSNKLAQLLNTTTKDLGTITSIRTGNTAVTLVTAANTPSSTTYTLVTSTTDTNSNGIPDFREGGQVDSSTTLSAVEINMHTTGRGILKKLK